jgi:hypothetical protein
LNTTIEDLGALDAGGNEVYSYGNPGEGKFTIFPSSGGTCTVRVGEACGFAMPKAKRQYDAMQLSLTRRFSNGWFADVSYVYSRLWGNYSGLQSTDEIRPPSLGYGFGPNQVFGAENYRPGGNANRYFDRVSGFSKLLESGCTGRCDPAGPQAPEGNDGAVANRECRKESG